MTMGTFTVSHTIWCQHNATADTFGTYHRSAGHRWSGNLSRLVVLVPHRFATVLVPGHQAAYRAKIWLI